MELLIILGVILGGVFLVMLFLAPLTLYSIDNKLGKILKELKKQNAAASAPKVPEWTEDIDKAAKEIAARHMR